MSGAPYISLSNGDFCGRYSHSLVFLATRRPSVFGLLFNSASLLSCILVSCWNMSPLENWQSWYIAEIFQSERSDRSFVAQMYAAEPYGRKCVVSRPFKLLQYAPVYVFSLLYSLVRQCLGPQIRGTSECCQYIFSQ